MIAIVAIDDELPIEVVVIPFDPNVVSRAPVVV
jgi:hypothetical protein